MANIRHLVRTVRTEDKNLFSGYSGDVYLAVLRDETNAMSVYDIFVNDASLDLSKFNDAPIGSRLTNINGGAMYLKTGATQWSAVNVTAQ